MFKVLFNPNYPNLDSKSPTISWRFDWKSLLSTPS